MNQRPTYYTHSTCKTSSTEVDRFTYFGNVYDINSVYDRELQLKVLKVSFLDMDLLG